MEHSVKHKESTDAPFQVTLRFGTFLLACLLWEFQGVHDLPPEVASLCQLFGLCGMAFYFCLEQSVNQLLRQRPEPSVNIGDLRLSFRLRAETNMARIIQRERSRL